MSIHFLHRAAVVPKAPPALFADKLDDLLSERRDACRSAIRAKTEAERVRFTSLAHRISERISRRVAE